MRVLLLACLSLFGVLSVQAQTGDISQVLAAKADYDANADDDTRAMLLAALNAYDGPPTVETVQAHWTVMINDSTEGDYKKMRESALAVETHVAPVSEILPQQYMEAKFVAAVAYFNDRQNRDALVEMTHVEGLLKTHRDENGDHPDWADSLAWRADAWGMAMQAYYVSSGKRHASEEEVDAILQSYWDKVPAPETEEEDAEDLLPTCPGALAQRPRMKYPAVKAMRGRFGAVILNFELDEEGRVVEPKVLASVPVEEFEERALKTVRKWRYKADKASEVGVTCRLSSSNVVLPIVFQLR